MDGLCALSNWGGAKKPDAKKMQTIFMASLCVCQWTWNWKSKKLFNRGRTSGCQLYIPELGMKSGESSFHCSTFNLLLSMNGIWFNFYIFYCVPPLTGPCPSNALLIVVVRPKGRTKRRKAFAPHRIDEGEMAKCSHGQSTWQRGHYSKHFAKPNTNIIDMHSSSPGSSSYLCSSAPFFFARVVGRERVQEQVAQLPGSYPAVVVIIIMFLYDNCSGKSCSRTIYSC